MKKIAVLALSCVMVAGMFAGCRRNHVNETVMPTVTTNTTAATTRPSTHATQPTQHTTHGTEATRETTVPILPSTTETIPGGSAHTENGRAARPQY